MSQEKISIRLDYCAERHLYVNHELPAFPLEAETLVEIQIASLEGLYSAAIGDRNRTCKYISGAFSIGRVFDWRAHAGLGRRARIGPQSA